MRALAVLLLLGSPAAAPTPEPGATTVVALEAQLRSASGEQRVALLNRLAELTSEDDFARALSASEEAARLASASGSQRAEAEALFHIGKVKTLMGRPEEAVPPLERSLEIAGKTGDRKATGDATNALGIAEYRRGRFREAAARFEQALVLWEQIGERVNQATTLTNLGSVHCQLGDKGCGEYFERALGLQRQLGNAKGEALALNNLGIARQHSGDYAGAVDAYLGSLAIEEKLGNRLGIARAAGNVGVVYKNLGQPEKALEYTRRSMAIDREMGDRHSLTTDLDNLGAIYADQGRFEQAIETYEEALRLAEEMKDPASELAIVDNLAEAESHFHRTAAAGRHYERALKLAQAAGMKAAVVSPLVGIAALQVEAREHEGARRNLARALEAATAADDKELLRDVHQAQAEAFAASGDYRRAYDAHVRFTAEQEAILHQEATDRIAELEARFAAEKRRREIELLKRDNEIQALRLRAERARSTALLGGLVAIAAVLLLLLRRYRHLLAFWRSRSHVGAYRILEAIGSGGMGVVYKAVHVRDASRPVAVKVLREEVSQDPVFRQRLRNEGSLIDQIEHPNIVRVYERGESDRRLYIVMEWLDGRTLAQVVRSGERLPIPECVSIMKQLASAVAKIHSRGIVHRDLKPENVMLVSESGSTTVKLLDFDIAKAGSLTRLTETGVVVGTVGYLAPERITRQAAAPEGDVFALGVVFYELLTLEKPFFGENAAQVVRQILEGEPLPPTTLRQDLPPALGELVLQMLRKDPGERPADASLAERLSEAAFELEPAS